MARLFDENTKEVRESQKAFAQIVGLVVFLLIPIAGIFCFIWEPLGKGLLFSALFTLAWATPSLYFASKELEGRS
jgi:hypothetical protein